MKQLFQNLEWILLIFSVILLSFDKENATSSDNIILTNIDYQGCFVDNPRSTLKSAPVVKDTVYYVVENNILKVNATIIYNCCGLLKDSVVINSNKVNIFIADSCTESCVCKCMCHYDFVYGFTNFLQKNTHFYFYLKGFDESGYQLWKNIKFTDASD